MVGLNDLDHVSYPVDGSEQLLGVVGRRRRRLQVETYFGLDAWIRESGQTDRRVVILGMDERAVVDVPEIGS